MPLYPPPAVGGGGGMAIGASVAGGTAPDLLYVGPSSVLAQQTNLPVSYLNGGTAAAASTFWRGDGIWSTLAGTAWITTFSHALPNDRTGWGGYNFRLVIAPALILAATSSSIRITLVAGPSTGFTISSCHIGYAPVSGGTACDFDPATIKALTFSGGAAGCTVAAGASILSDAVTFTYDSTGTRNFVLAVYCTAGGDFGQAASSFVGSNAWYGHPGSDDTATAVTSGYGIADGNTVELVSKIEILGTGSVVSIGDSIGSSTSPAVLFIGPGNVLAQDATNFSFDDTNYRLKVGHSGSAAIGAYDLNGVPAIYEVPNASGNNWFEGNSGNFTLTGYQNFGTGDASLSSLTSGFANTAVGTNACQHLTTGANNFVFGTGALAFSQTDSYNTMIGFNCGGQLGISGAGGGGNVGNFCAGYGALGNATQGAGNVAIGYTALSNITASATQNVVIGPGAGGGLGTSGTSVLYNTLIGPNAGSNLQGASSSNTWVGGFHGVPSATGNHTIAFSDGNGTALLDLGLTNANAWSFSPSNSGQNPTGLHVYNTQDVSSFATFTNYERAILDWNATLNVFRIASQAGGTGVVRQIAIDGFAKAGAPVAADLPAGTFGLIDDTSGGATWLCFNHGGTLRKVQLT